ncbi:GGDEF domain-containing protein [Vibrio sp. M60_M70]|jgi:diguanylate cyclase (GGDEF)-like protein|uniref:GGDEF domain-containing protein n=1 Tax=Vibrio sp. M60_M70 TaxID=3035166 RepID=UPI00301DD8AE
MEKDLERYHEKFLNDKEIYSIALIDIDNFKMINDNYGHTFGDEVLKEISKKIKESIRRTDKVYRYGGEEILVCFRGKNVEQVFDIINRLRKKVGLHRDYNVDFNLEITFSAGVATPEVSDLTYIDVIDRADEKLYSAKKSGKNRVGF